jgi:2-succinyl-6-hydroxy-2,4-cyclohexadiene-1-carboxylate synthase
VAESVVLLHGFTGTRRAWDGVVAHLPPERYSALALDLPGHGELADAPRPITFDGCVSSVLERSPKRFALAGYSMGGRIALHVALIAPQRVARLVLIGANPGIEDEPERERRRQSDRLLAEQLEKGPFEDFIERWRTQPLFADEPPHVGDLARADQRRNRPDALGAVLRGLGTGEMAPLWNRLPEIELPVTVLAGERDAKFRAIGERMIARLPDARLRVVPGGHGVLFESPADVAAAITSA